MHLIRKAYRMLLEETVLALDDCNPQNREHLLYKAQEPLQYLSRPSGIPAFHFNFGISK